jgi:hypothetical protein
MSWHERPRWVSPIFFKKEPHGLLVAVVLSTHYRAMMHKWIIITHRVVFSGSIASLQRLGSAQRQRLRVCLLDRLHHASRCRTIFHFFICLVGCINLLSDSHKSQSTFSHVRGECRSTPFLLGQASMELERLLHYGLRFSPFTLAHVSSLDLWLFGRRPRLYNCYCYDRRCHAMKGRTQCHQFFLKNLMVH